MNGHNLPMDELDITLRAVASAELVNRTHRVVRERAQAIKSERTRNRSLWLLLLVCGSLLIIIFCWLWNALDQNELTPVGLPDASQQMLLLMWWCLPVTVLVLIAIWFRRVRSRDQSRSMR